MKIMKSKGMMKRTFFALSTGLLLFSACSNNEIYENQDQSNIIAFENFNDRVTRAANDQESPYGVFAVWNRLATDWFMINQEVKNDDTYSPVKYWPSQNGDNVSFYAYAPFMGTGITATDINSATINYTIPTSANDQIDLTVATPALDKTSSDGKVALSFNHMLCKVKLGTVALAESLVDAGYSINATNATITVNSKNSGGTINIMDMDAALDSWTSKTSLENALVTFAGEKEYYMMPHANSTDISIKLCDIIIKYGDVVYYSGNIELYQVNAGDITNTNSVLNDKGPNKFNRGSKYTVNFTIGTNANDDKVDPKPIFGPAIEFESSVVVWKDESFSISIGNSVSSELNQQ